MVGLCERNEAKKFVQEYLATHPFVDCGETNPIVLEFEHVRGKKKASISKMAHEGYLLHRSQKEIAKCEVRCANCRLEFYWPSVSG